MKKKRKSIKATLYDFLPLYGKKRLVRELLEFILEIIPLRRKV